LQLKGIKRDRLMSMSIDAHWINLSAWFLVIAMPTKSSSKLGGLKKLTSGLLSSVSNTVPIELAPIELMCRFDG